MKRPFTSESFSPAELDTALQIAVRATQEVSNALKENFGVSTYNTKHGDERDWVTHWDTWAEERIRAKLSSFSTAVGFCGEEGGIDASREVYWTIDPIDGTSHFVRGNDFCTTMVSLVDHGSPVAAIIHDFIRGDAYTAVAQGGAFKNFDKPLRVSNRSIETSYLELYTNEETPEGQRLRATIERTGAYLLRNAATGFTLASIARGSTEGFMAINNPYGSEWDIAPGSLLIHEAGGVVRNVGEEGFSSKSFDMIAANPAVFSRLAELAIA